MSTFNWLWINNTAFRSFYGVSLYCSHIFDRMQAVKSKFCKTNFIVSIILRLLRYFWLNCNELFFIKIRELYNNIYIYINGNDCEHYLLSTVNHILNEKKTMVYVLYLLSLLQLCQDLWIVLMICKAWVCSSKCSKQHEIQELCIYTKDNLPTLE